MFKGLKLKRIATFHAKIYQAKAGVTVRPYRLWQTVLRGPHKRGRETDSALLNTRVFG